MKTFRISAAQGDLLIRRIDKLPEDVKPADGENGRYILAHSETGHFHSTAVLDHVKHYKGMDELRSFLVVENIPAEIKHERSFDTHESLKVEPGVYEIRNQREYQPGGFRRAQD